MSELATGIGVFLLLLVLAFLGGYGVGTWSSRGAAIEAGAAHYHPETGEVLYGCE